MFTSGTSSCKMAGKRPMTSLDRDAHQARQQSSITVAWCIRSCYHMVVRSIKSIVLKLWAGCEKQYEENVRFCGIDGFCITIMPLIACGRFFGQKQHHNHASLSHHIHRIWPHVTFSCSQN